ncbi:hypothetical protein EDB89DRAFT_2241091 [Lactarius sanguifluus]|nr:hypothetical protein EDB89DRAFT_2241091 [Lactarius sanguifluus]
MISRSPYCKPLLQASSLYTKMKHHSQPTSGPSAKSRRNASPDTEPMAVDPPASPVVLVVSTGRDPPDGVLSTLIPVVAKTRKYDSMDATLKSDEVLIRIYTLVSSAFALRDSAMGLVNIDEFKMNLTKKSASGFVNLLRGAINGNNEELWSPVVTHDVFHTKIPNDLTSGENRVHRKYQEEAVTKSRKVQFIGDRMLTGLTVHFSNLVTMRGVAASEPIFSEVASLVMRDDPNFNLPNALINIHRSIAYESSRFVCHGPWRPRRAAGRSILHASSGLVRPADT